MEGLLHMYTMILPIKINIGATNKSSLFDSLFAELWRKESTLQIFIVVSIFRLPSNLPADVISLTMSSRIY